MYACNTMGKKNYNPKEYLILMIDRQTYRQFFLFRFCRFPLISLQGTLKFKIQSLICFISDFSFSQKKTRVFPKKKKDSLLFFNLDRKKNN